MTCSFARNSPLGVLSGSLYGVHLLDRYGPACPESTPESALFNMKERGAFRPIVPKPIKRRRLISRLSLLRLGHVMELLPVWIGKHKTRGAVRFNSEPRTDFQGFSV